MKKKLISLLIALLFICGVASADYKYNPFIFNFDYYEPASGSVLGDLSDITFTITASGDLIYRNASSKWVNLAKGTDHQILSLASGLPAWVNLPSVRTDRWLLSDTNTFFGIGVVGAGNLAHSAGQEGWWNAAVGANSLYACTTGSWNMAVGSYALYSNTTGCGNTAVGNTALFYNVSGTNNVAVGKAALNYCVAGYNTAIGAIALDSITSGTYNIGVGYYAGSLDSGSNYNETSLHSIYIGYHAKALADGGDNEIVIGDQAVGAGSNTATLGNASITKIYLSGAVHDRLASDTDSDTNDVLLTGLVASYGMLIVRESTGGITGVFRIENQTIVVISVEATFTITKDNAATYNVYWDTDQYKIQNKVGDNKNIACAFYGIR